MVYEPNKDGSIYALNITTGELVWNYQGPGTMLFPGMPTVADGKVYVTSGQDASFGTEVGESEFVCLDAYTGEAFWKLSIEAFAPRESVAVAYGKLFVIPSNITTAIDSFSGSEYDAVGQVWAFGSSEAQAGDGSWSMFRHDAGRSSIGNDGPSNLALAWNYTTNGSVMSSPSVVNGLVYFGSQDMNVYAVDISNGELVWKYQTNGTIESSPAVVNGKVFIGSDDGHIYCLDAYSGNLIWKQFVNSSLPLNHGSVVMLRSSPAVVGDSVYVGSVDGNLYALDADNGEIVWKHETGGIITSSPTVADGAVYVTSEEPDEGGLYKLDAGDGTLIWRKSLKYVIPFTGGTDMQGTPTVVDGMVFVSTNLREYYAVNASSGETVWKYTNPAAIEFIVSSPIYVDGKVFIVDKFDIACLDAKTGDKLWSSYYGDELYVSPSYAKDKIYVITSQRHLFVMNATDGVIISNVTMPSASWSSPTLVDGRLYVGNNDWNIYCFTDCTATETPFTLELPPEFAYGIALLLVLAIIGIVLFRARSKPPPKEETAPPPPTDTSPESK
jgi:outer membrane protein assembly factor BamB